MSRGIPPRISYLLRDPNTDAVVVQDLVHLHQSKWTVRALRAGYPGSTTLGDFTIPLPAPGTPAFTRFRPQYEAIQSRTSSGIGLKVEGYLGDHADGVPVVSGVVTKMDLPLGAAWSLSGFDTLFWAQQSQTLPGELIALQGELTTDAFRAWLGTMESLWDDDFTNWNGGGVGHVAADYNVSGFSFAAADPVFGKPALVSTGAAESYVTTTSSWQVTSLSGTPPGTYHQSVTTIHGVLVASTAGPGSAAGQMGIYLIADANPQNAVMAQLVLNNVSFGIFNVDVAIFTRSAGTFTAQASASSVFTNVLTPFPFELSVVASPVAFGPVSSAWSLRVFVNGKDTGCAVTALGFPPLPSGPGRIGLRCSVSAGGSPAMYVNRITFHSRTSAVDGIVWGSFRFPLGNHTDLGTVPLNISSTGQTHLDALQLVAALDNIAVRKNPGAGMKADSLDYGGGGSLRSPGTNFSDRVVFRENGNIVANGTVIQNVAEAYSSDVKLNAIPGSDSGGSVTWERIAAVNDMVLTDQVADIGIPSYVLLVAYARAIQARKASPLTAKQVAVLRTPDLVAINDGLGPRELDVVRVVMPTYNLDQIAEVAGFVLDETSEVQVFFLDDFPADALAEAGDQRFQRALDYLTGTYQRR